ncbi:MAG: hypothetical protein COW58_14360 [Thalassolituus sp. CG17_big_fil_post_rev_8_21_14_2_50_53_8]|nr:MAG: hypothetical protein COW58_14360 [Thalassolituus sp. CG17_big_fil_post_rev_8_21_14_2_50_53_8]
MAQINSIYADRLMAVAAAIGRLSALGVAVIEIDINRARPVINVQPCAAVRKLKGVQFARRGTPTGPVNRHQANLNDCRIEWEVHP